MYYNLDQLVHKLATSPKQVFLWGGIKSVSLGFFYGISKTGKTILCENLLIAFSLGHDKFWGLDLPGKPIKTLYVSLEEDILNRAERLKAQVSNLTSDEKILLNDNYMLNDEHFPTFFTKEADWKCLEKLIITSKAKVVVIDSLTRLCDGDIEKSKTATQISQRLRKLAYDNKICLIVVHHAVKSQGRVLDQVTMAGSRVLAAESDFIYGLARTVKEERYFKEITLRYKAEDNENVQVYVINENYWLEPVGACKESDLLKEDDKRFGSNLQDELITFIDDKKEATTSEIHDHFQKLKYPKRTIDYSLRAIAIKNYVDNTTKGTYKSIIIDD